MVMPDIGRSGENGIKVNFLKALFFTVNGALF
jgi:hypothetical protein